MNNNSIQAIHHSEERYTSLTLIAYSTEQRNEITNVLNKEIPQNKEDVQVSESEVDSILETTIEYHDDYDKKSGGVFDNILKALNINECN